MILVTNTALPAPSGALVHLQDQRIVNTWVVCLDCVLVALR